MRTVPVVLRDEGRRFTERSRHDDRRCKHQAGEGQMIDQQKLGQQLRKMRTANHLSLKQVEKLSKGRFKASIVGSYERGERSVSAYRLVELASLYGVSPAYVVSEASRAGSRRRHDPNAGIRVDVQRVAQIGKEGYRDLKTFIDSIRVARDDPTQTILTLRDQDLPQLSAALGTPTRETLAIMEQLELLVHPQ